MNTTEVVDALEQVWKTNIHEIVISFIVATVVLLLLKSIAEALVGYIQFVLDKHIAIGSPIEVYGKKGRIKEVSIFTLTVETECGHIRIPFKAFRTSKYIMLKDKLFMRNRRYDDPKEEDIKEL